ncbi:MAG: IS200/IS605 family transposase [Bacteroidota bacterium]
MPQSLVKIYLHIIFSTKNRQEVLSPDLQPALYDYIGGICRKINCSPIRIGGHNDHMHILCIQSKSITLIDLIKQIKTGSSRWMKTQGDCFNNFHWQDGYGSFSVSPAETQNVSSYIDNQKEHHRHHTFQEEFRAFLIKYDIPYDERYVWD